MKIVLNTQEIREACAAYVRQKHPAFATRPLRVNLHSRAATEQELFAAEHGLSRPARRRIAGNRYGLIDR